MIQFNLLPDVKLEYIKARRTKHIVLLSSVLLTAVTVGIMVVMFMGVHVVQKRHLSNLDRDIQQMGNKLKEEKDIDKILTVQQQLDSLNELHDAKPAADRIGAYLSQITPGRVAVSSLSIDFAENTMKFDGKAGAIKNINEFIDTMKFTTYEIKESVEGGSTETVSKPAFSNVVLASFGRTSSSDDAMPATYSITLSFDPVIFDIKQKPKLVVPKQITTRSVTERAAPLFQQQSTEEGQ